MGREIGGFEEHPDWPKLGPSLLIATCLILAIRTAKRPPLFDQQTSDMELNREIEYAAHLAGRVLSALISSKESMFPRRKVPWYHPNEEDNPR